MCHKERIVIMLVLFLFIACALEANELTLPSKDKKVYASSETRLYDLKIKLKPKIVESTVYWQGEGNIDWQEEIDNWHFGLLPKDKIIIPFVIDRVNFYTGQDDFNEEYLYGKNNMHLLVFNSLNAKVLSYIEFSAYSYKKDRTLEIWVNKKLIDKVKIPKGKFEDFKIKDILLEPGINMISFFCPKETDEPEPKEGREDIILKEASIKFTEFRFTHIEAIIENIEIIRPTAYIKCFPESSFVDIVFSTKEPIIFGREIDVNLEEFPIIDMELQFKITANVKKLIAFFGVDFTDDGIIDGYLKLEEFGCGHNLLQKAKDIWQEPEKEFRLKRIIFLLLPDNKQTKENQIGTLKLKDIRLYNKNSLILAGKEFERGQLRFEDINTTSDEIIKQKKIISLISYFDGAPDEDKSRERNSIKDKNREPEEVRIFIPLEGIDWKSYPYFSFRYNIGNSQIQDIEIGMLVEESGKKRILNLTENQYEKTKEEINVNLKQISSGQFNIKNLIIGLKRREEADCSLPETKGWYQFQLIDLRLFEKFPYPLRDNHYKAEFLNLIKMTDSKLLKIDKRELKLNDFQGWQDYGALEKGILSKRLQLTQGKHNYKKLENPIFDVEWVIIEPVVSYKEPEVTKAPVITFKKINPTKYLVKVEGAEFPFWLVFSESFHKQWRIYNQILDNRYQIPEFEEIIGDYPNLKVKETRHLAAFTPQDIRYLFKKPLNVEHHLVNGYANGWYIKPKRLGLGEDFILVLYFWPQSLFYLGLGISGITLIGCIGYLGISFCKNRK